MIRKLQGKISEVKKTGEFIEKDGETWEKCIFTVELSKFSKRTSEEILPENLRGKRVKVIRYCCFNWHYKTDVMKTLEPDETEAILNEKPNKTIYW